jgi:hypothetical protein
MYAGIKRETNVAKERGTSEGNALRHVLVTGSRVVRIDRRVQMF